MFCDGNYWHCYPTGKPRDWYVNKILIDNEYSVLRFWGSEIKEDVDWCVKRILVEMQNKTMSNIDVYLEIASKNKLQEKNMIR